MIAAACTPTDRVVIFTVFATIIVLVVLFYIVDAIWGDATSPRAQYARLEKEERRAVVARAKQLMEAGMTYQHAVGMAQRERQQESDDVLFSLLDAEKVARGEVKR